MAVVLGRGGTWGSYPFAQWLFPSAEVSSAMQTLNAVPLTQQRVGPLTKPFQITTRSAWTRWRCPWAKMALMSWS